MRLNRIRLSILVGLGGLLLMISFQNMSLVEFAKLKIPEVDEDSRRDQARELLGAYYKRSLARKLEGNQYLSYLVYKEIDRSLKPRLKHRVPELAQAIIKESREHEFDPVFILAVIHTESMFDPHARGSAGEIGLMQILPKTAEWISNKTSFPWRGDKSLFDPVTNVKIGIRYFAYLRSQFDGTAYHYLPAYNMGPKNLRKLDRKQGSVDSDGHVFKREYAMKVMKNYFNIYQQMAQEEGQLDQLAKLEDDKTDVQ